MQYYLEYILTEGLISIVYAILLINVRLFIMWLNIYILYSNIVF